MVTVSSWMVEGAVDPYPRAPMGKSRCEGKAVTQFVHHPGENESGILERGLEVTLDTKPNQPIHSQTNESNSQ